MDPLAVVLVLVAVALTVWVVATPLRAGRMEEDEREEEALLADLEAAKQARYREIREAEMDYRTGKLSEADWRTIDRELRAEAVEVLRRLDEVAPQRPGGPADAPPALAEPDVAAVAAEDPSAADEVPAERVGRPPAA